MKRASQGRQTFTAGLCFGPTFKGFGVLIFSRLPEATQKLIEADFGEILKVYTTKTGSVQSQFHVQTLIPGAFSASAQRLRNLSKVSPEALVLFEEDCAPSHVGDRDSHTGATDLQKERREALKAARLLRHLLPLNGTPNFSKNDMLHDILRKDMMERLKVLSLRAQNFHERPSTDLRQHGGIAFSKKGYHRAPGKYLIAKVPWRVKEKWRVGQGAGCKEVQRLFVQLTQCKASPGSRNHHNSTPTRPETHPKSILHSPYITRNSSRTPTYSTGPY